MASTNMMAFSTPVLSGGVVAFLGLLWTIFMLRLMVVRRSETKLARRITGSRVVPIAAAPAGRLVRVRGRVVSSERGAVTSPLTGRRCVYYLAEIMRAVGSTRNGTRWAAVRDERDQRGFWLEDGTGSVFVEPVDARKLVPAVRFGGMIVGKVIGGMPTDSRPLEGPALAWAVQRAGDGRLMVKEHVIAEGEDVTATGVATSHNGTLVFRHSEDQPLFLTSLTDKRLREIFGARSIARTVLLLIGLAMVFGGAAAVALFL